jgi:dTDP-4-amino-4,6-dideoxygalactose transaminase
MYKEMASAHQNNLPIATEVAKQVLCLPIYPELGDDELNQITEIVKGS